MRKKSNRADDESDINITPMLDIVFIMLIFFIVTTSFVKEPGISPDRPSAETAQPKPRGNIAMPNRKTCAGGPASNPPVSWTWSRSTTSSTACSRRCSGSHDVDRRHFRQVTVLQAHQAGVHECVLT